MKWNDDQLKAIETTGKNILISAAAGSGKTAVLVARITNLVLNGSTSIDKFLITTFTKAAASEMKERLEKAIREEMKKPDANKAMLTRQLQLLPGASIGTFHSFAIEIIKQYFYLTDLEPGFSIGDEIQMSLMKRDAINKVFENKYEENSEEFKLFILKHSSSKGDGKLKENILDIYRTLVSIPGYIDWAYNEASKLNTSHPMETIRAYSFMVDIIDENISQAIAHFNNAAEIAKANGFTKALEKIYEDLDTVTGLLESSPETEGKTEAEIREEIEAFYKRCEGIKFSVMRFSKEENDETIKEKIKREKNAGKSCFNDIKLFINTKSNANKSFDTYESELKEAYPDTKFFVDLIDGFINTFREMKAAENVIDFDDVMHYALQILDNKEATNELREKYEYIFVDEYQDSNYIQEEIIKKIARNDNLFMVGDVKQCIYKFRLAEPEIFKDKAAKYDRDDEESSILINLNNNYRSKINVTEPINEVFRGVMEGYDKSTQLNCSVSSEYSGFPVRMNIINREEFDRDAPDKGDAEAAVVAEIIKEKLGCEIFDTKANQFRTLRYKDFAVIVRNNSTVEKTERYLINEGIPAYGEGSGKYFETVEVKVFLNLLRIIDNMRQDIPLISAMKSVVFGFTIEELVQIRAESRTESFYSAVIKYSENGSKNSIKEKINRMIDTVLKWKEISRTVPLEELMKVILYDTGYYDYCSGLPAATQRISNLSIIAEKAARFEEISHGGLFGFLRYIESMQDVGETDSEAKIIGEKDDVVRVMNVHKSKGLEFPVVIFANASKGTKTSGHDLSIGIHRDCGIGVGLVNREEHWHRKTFLQKMIKAIKDREKVEEEIRILYVALTRAKDGLEIIGTVKKEDEVAEIANTNTFLNMMYEPLSQISNVVTRHYNNWEELDSAHEHKMHSVSELFHKVNAATTRKDKNEELIAKRLSFTYSYTEESTVKPKYSVSELNKNEMKQSVKIADFAPEMEKRTLTAAQKGTIMHLLMEKTDFVKAIVQGNEYIQAVADELLASETINAEEYDSLNIDKIAAFFAEEVGKRAANASDAGMLHKEREFILNKEIDGVVTVVQGIIDCFFEENDDIVLIDYKSNYVGYGRTREEIVETYRQQMELYRDALEGATRKRVKEAYLFLYDIGEFIEM